jgi:hypothetical protein
MWLLEVLPAESAGLRRIPARRSERSLPRAA